MTNQNEPSSDAPEGDAAGGVVPFLPPRDAAGGLPYLPAAPSAQAPGEPVADLPYLPAAPRPEPPAATTSPAFDAKAMVESQKHVVANPVYGAIPTATAESMAAAAELRAKAQRIRRRNKLMGWVVALVMLGGIGAAGWLAYRAYQDEQDQRAADREDRADDDTVVIPGALTPLGEQEQVIELLDDLNSGGAAPSAGALLDAVDDARSVVDDVNGSTAGQPNEPAALTLGDVLPDMVIGFATRLDDSGGYERYVVDARQFEAASPDAYRDFVGLLQAQPQVDPQSPELAVLPSQAPGQIGIAVERVGDRLGKGVVRGVDPDIRVVVTDQ